MFRVYEFVAYGRGGNPEEEKWVGWKEGVKNEAGVYLVELGEALVQVVGMVNGVKGGLIRVSCSSEGWDIWRKGELMSQAPGQNRPVLKEPVFEEVSVNKGGLRRSGEWCEYWCEGNPGGWAELLLLDREGMNVKELVMQWGKGAW